MLGSLDLVAHWTLCRQTTALVFELPASSLDFHELPVVAARVLAGEALSSGAVLVLVLADVERCLEGQAVTLDTGTLMSRIQLVEASQMIVASVAVY